MTINLVVDEQLDSQQRKSFPNDWEGFLGSDFVGPYLTEQVFPKVEKPEDKYFVVIREIDEGKSRYISLALGKYPEPIERPIFPEFPDFTERHPEWALRRYVNNAIEYAFAMVPREHYDDMVFVLGEKYESLIKERAVSIKRERLDMYREVQEILSTPPERKSARPAAA